MRVSIIIPNLHSPIIDRTLESIREQTYGLTDVEVIVVGMDKYEIVQKNELVYYYRTERPVSPAVARNLGIKVAQGEIICFIDADCVAAPDWLDVLIARYSDPSVHVVGGGIDFPRDNYWTVCDNFSWFHEVLAIAPAGMRPYLPTLNLSLHREVVEQVGGMDESFPWPAGEDTEWTTRIRLAGYALHFEPNAVIYHHHPRNTLKQILKHAYYFGYNSVKVDPRYADALRTPPFMRHSLSVLLLAPLLAAGATGRVLVNLRHYLHTLPAIYLTKLSWCIGAARRLRG
jgi:glycosyltransferase involved in cell wall biosynthesis